MGSRLDIDVVRDADGWEAIVSDERVVALGQAAFAAAVASKKPASCAIALSSDAAVRKLNRQFRGKDKPTNVLSFPSPAGQGGFAHLGDVILARETVLREAAVLGIPPEHHALHLVVHGLLHLLGHDHQTEADADRMERLETAILNGFGIADPHDEKDQPVLPDARPAKRA